jgi:AIPR protein
MDRITKSHLEAFKQEQSLVDLPEDDAFELFASYCVVSDAYDDEFDIHDVHVGGEGDLGLDGASIIVNGALVTSAEEVGDLVRVNGYIDATFMFVQAKTSSSFKGEQISTFFDGVDEFFAETPGLPMNDAVENARGVMQTIYNNSVKFRHQKPLCRLYYVTTGQWQADRFLLGKVEQRLDRLRTTGLFSDVSFTPMGADELHESYQRSKNSVTAEITFASKVVLPEIDGVSQAYLGVLPVTEFLRLIADNAGNIRKSLFYDNIRDFQDYNQVNAEIQATLKAPQGQRRFAVLNNGVTIVTRGLLTTGNKFLMTDYQIVNGCQTSHVLFNESETLTDSVFVPLKVIATEDEEVINSIISATNRQTQVTTEDLYALGAFQKRLEALFLAYPGKKRLYYERRSRQYSAATDIEKVRIITKPQQIRAFAAMFLDDPHRASRYYADLRAQVGEKIFNEQHKLEPYYTAAYAYYKLEYLFRNGLLPVYYKPARYHLLMAFRYVVGGLDMPALTANKVQTYCNKICETLWNDTASAGAFRRSIEVIEAALGGTALTRDTVKVQSFTDAVRVTLGLPSKSAHAQ